MSDTSIHSPSPASIPNDLMNSVEAELRAEATPVATPEPSYTPDPEPTPFVTQPTPEQRPDPEEANRGYMRHSDYTQKTMSLAEERRAFEAQRQTELLQRQQQEAYYQNQLAQYQAALNDPDHLAQRAAALRQHLNIPAGDTQPTAEQVQTLLARQQQALETRFEAKLQDTLARHTIETMKFEFGNQIQSYQQTLLKEFPDLDLVPGVEKLITTQAMEQRPKDLAEAKSIMRTLAQERNQKLQKKIADSEQAAIMRHAKSQKTSIEPRGGQAPAVQATPKNVRLGSKELEALIMSDLAAEQSSKR